MNRDYGKKGAYSTAVKKMADGGEVASSEGFFDRLKRGLGRLAEGNIDAEGSVAYNKYGKGAQAGIESSDARQLARNEAAAPAPAPEPAATPAVEAGMSEKEPGWDTKPDAAPAAEKPKAAKKMTAPPARAAVKSATQIDTSTAPTGPTTMQKLGKDYQTAFNDFNSLPADAPLAARTAAGKRMGAATEALDAGQASRGRRYADGGMVKGYADGGMVKDGRSYGKKC